MEQGEDLALGTSHLRSGTFQRQELSSHRGGYGWVSGANHMQQAVSRQGLNCYPFLPRAALPWEVRVRWLAAARPCSPGPRPSSSPSSALWGKGGQGAKGPHGKARDWLVWEELDREEG